MYHIKFSEKIRNAAPGLRVLAIEAAVENPPTPDSLWLDIEKENETIRNNCPLESVNKRPAIAATRAAYKKLGKEPNRYRPSAEALCRRAVNGTGHSIGGFDADKIVGEVLTLDSGHHEEEFHAIGRGLLNIENLPVYRDAIGGIGTPTSDEERTKLTPETSHLLMLINVYDKTEDIEALRKLTLDLFQTHCNPRSINTSITSI